MDRMCRRNEGSLKFNSIWVEKTIGRVQMGDLDIEGRVRKRYT
jgi:hypothetical protein